MTTDEQLNALRRALGDEGYSSPYMASVRDWPDDPAGLRAADEQADRANLDALRRAVEVAGWAPVDDPPADGLCHHPHPTRRGRSCTEPAGHAGDDLRGASHGDGRVDRWLVR